MEEFFDIEYNRVRKNYQPKHSAFGGRDGLPRWYVEKLMEQDCRCHYCGTSIHDIRKLIQADLLRTRSVRGGGMRGPVLEIDKQGNTYVPQSCVLACYYCNNDKSYTTSGEDYKVHFGPARKRYFDHLLSKLNTKHGLPV